MVLAPGPYTWHGFRTCWLQVVGLGPSVWLVVVIFALLSGVMGGYPGLTLTDLCGSAMHVNLAMHYVSLPRIESPIK